MDAVGILWCILLGGPVAVLAICIACRWHVVLLWMGLACFLLMQLMGVSRHSYPGDSFASRLITFVGVLLMLTSVVLLAGGAVRWGLARPHIPG